MKKEIKVGDNVKSKSNYFDTNQEVFLFEINKEYSIYKTDRLNVYVNNNINKYTKFGLYEFLDFFELVEEKTDPIVESVVNKFLQRSKVGIDKYGTTLHENNNDNFLNHLQEELMDATNYIEKLKSQQNNTQEKVIEWAKERNLIKLGNAPKQLIKLSEEVGELGSAFLKNDYPEIKDAIGDIMIVLTILCEQLSIDMNQCYDDAYEVIKDRKGRTENGTFIRDESN